MAVRTFDLDLASRLYLEGLALTEIGERVGASHSSVVRATRSHPDLFPPRAKLKRRLKVHHAEDAIDAAAQLWSDGASLRQIALRVGCSTTKLEAIRKAHPDRFPDRAPTRSPSVDDAIDLTLAETLWAGNVSLVVIAAKLGVSDRVVERLVGRRRDLFPKRGAIPRAARSSAGGARAPRKVTVASAKPVAAAPPRPMPEPVGAVVEDAIERPMIEDAFRPLPNVAPVLLFECTGCSWPVHTAGDPMTSTARHFCGAPRGAGKTPYCPTHRALARRVAEPVVFTRRRALVLGAHG